MILFYDTETTGFVDERCPPEADHQPHLVQLACLLTEDDGTERAAVNLIIKPAGWQIPKQASNVHGITTEIANICGVSEAFATAAWCRLMAISDHMVAHNLKFDWAVMQTAVIRSGQWFQRDGAPTPFCTMEAAAPIINLPPTERMLAAGFTKPKPPKLEECIKYFFNEELTGAHDAMVDVRACARLYFHLKSQKES